MRINENHHLAAEDEQNLLLSFQPSIRDETIVQTPKRTLVIHAPTCASVSGAVGVLQTKPTKARPFQRSTHIVLGRDGREIVQMVSFNNGAFHTYGLNNKSIAIDLQYPGELLEKGASFQFKGKFSKDEFILASPLNGSRYGFWPLYPKVQLDTLLALARVLKNRYEITDVIAYDEIQPAMHPGPAFPIIHFREILLGVNDRSILLQEISRAVELLGQPGEADTHLQNSFINKGTPVSVLNEKDNWYLISVIEEVGGNPWLIGWVEKNAVRVKTDFIPSIRPDHYLTTDDGRRFQEIKPHPNGYDSSDRNPAPKYIIMHFTTGTKMESTISHFKNSSAGVSTHLLIGRDGRVTQFLPFDRIAYHCGYSWWERQSNLNAFSIGIELDNAGMLRKGKDGTWKMRSVFIPNENVQQAVHWKQFRANDPKRYPAWEKYTDVQLQVALNIVKALVKRYDSIKEILGHDDVNIRNRYDPGPLFPMKEFRKALFNREAPLIDVHTVNQKTDLYTNFGGRLPNMEQRTHDLALPKDAVVRVLREDDEQALVSIISSKEPRLKGRLGWISSGALTPPDPALPNKKKGDIPDKRTTTRNQVFFRNGAKPPTPKLSEGPFNPGTRVRIQQVRGEWTLVVVLDAVKGRVGLEGWIRTEFISPDLLS